LGNLAAHLIYLAMAAGKLRWIGVADRGAGSFDDIVLGLADRTQAYQVKTKGTPEPFTVSTVLTGGAMANRFDVEVIKPCPAA